MHSSPNWVSIERCSKIPKKPHREPFFWTFVTVRSSPRSSGFLILLWIECRQSANVLQPRILLAIIVNTSEVIAPPPVAASRGSLIDFSQVFRDREMLINTRSYQISRLWIVAQHRQSWCFSLAGFPRRVHLAFAFPASDVPFKVSTIESGPLQPFH